MDLSQHRYSYGAIKATCPARLELEAIKRCLYSGASFPGGLTLAEHTKKFIKLAWPNVDQHRWFHMEVDEIAKADTLAIWGPASSGKTGISSLVMLSWYWAVPEKFTGLVSTTDLIRLEVRVWGEIKMRFKEARERYPWLAGHMIDSRQRISTDAKDAEGRDFRNGILGIACRKSSGEWQGLSDYCFPAGQLVDTANGTECISTIEAGDRVHTALGLQRVARTGSRIAMTLVRVKLSDGRVIDCTPEHPFLTQMGWQNAVDLDSQHLVFSPDETLQIVRGAKPVWSGPPSLLQRDMQTGVNQTEMRLVSDLLHSERSKECLLRESVCEQMENVPSVVCENDSRQDRPSGKRSQDQRVDHAQSRRQGKALTTAQEPNTRREVSAYEKELEATLSEQRESLQDLEAWRAQLPREDSVGVVPRSAIRTFDSFRASRRRISALLFTGPWMAEPQAGRGDRWRDSSATSAESTRQAQRASVSGTRVASVEILERAGDERYNEREGGYRVYNLQVEGHPSYSVAGVVVHNSGIKNDFVMLIGDESHAMASGFLQGANNLKANNNKGRFIGLYLGNMIDLETPLGEAGEPACGWDALPDSDVSRAYDTKFFGGRAIQFVGTDSPNYDFPTGQEPYAYLIGRKFIERLKHDCGEGSPEYIAQAGGTIPRTSLANRVITKEVCKKFNAFEIIVWGATQLTKLYAMDVSYTTDHGDRTCGAPMAFGTDIDGRSRLSYLERPKIYQFPRLETGTTLEDSIAMQVKTELARFGIQDSHFFYDGTGRSSFTSAAMRIISTQIQPVEFGGKASERPNFVGRKFKEGPQKGELVPCFQVFDKFVTELWFATRYLIEADQMRELPEDTARDGYQRQWLLVAGNKMSVESKKDMKQRVGRSPDLYDTFAVGVEGARRLGFVIGQGLGAKNSRGAAWLGALGRDYKEQVKAKELSYG